MKKSYIIKRFFMDKWEMIVIIALVFFFLLQQFSFIDGAYFYRKAFEQTVNLSQQKDISIPYDIIKNTSAEKNREFMKTASSELELIWKTKTYKHDFMNNKTDIIIYATEKPLESINIPILQKDITVDKDFGVFIGKKLYKESGYTKVLDISGVSFPVLAIIGEKGINGYFDDKVIINYLSAPKSLLLFDEKNIVSDGYSIVGSVEQQYKFLEKVSSDYNMILEEVELLPSTTKTLPTNELALTVLRYSMSALLISFFSLTLISFTWWERNKLKVGIKHMLGAKKIVLLKETFLENIFASLVSLTIVCFSHQLSIFFDLSLIYSTRTTAYLVCFVFSILYAVMLGGILMKPLKNMSPSILDE